MSSDALSSNVKKMKFMQRSAEAEIRAKLADERDRELRQAHWVAPAAALADGVRLETARSIVEGLIGRRSYRGFNKEIEKLNASQRERLGVKKVDRRESGERAARAMPVDSKHPLAEAVAASRSRSSGLLSGRKRSGSDAERPAKKVKRVDDA